MVTKKCEGNQLCLWSDSDNFCHVLRRAKVPLDDKWPVLILQLRAIDQDPHITSNQKVDLQSIMLDVLKKKNFSEERYREVRRQISAVYLAPQEEKIKNITKEVEDITREITRVLGSHKEDVLSVANTMDEEISQGNEPSSILETLRTTLREVITKMERDTLLFKDLSTKDSLTGLANRRSCDIYLSKSIELFFSDNTPVTLLIFDIDNFKSFNDQYGHLVGDQVLRRIASLAEKTVLSVDEKASGDWLAARFGGDEFVLILRGELTNSAEKLGEGLRKAVAKSALLIRDAQGSILESGLHVTISLGFSPFDKSWDDNCAENLLSYADKALYEAKRNGRNCVAAYDVVANKIRIITEKK